MQRKEEKVAVAKQEVTRSTAGLQTFDASPVTLSRTALFLPQWKRSHFYGFGFSLDRSHTALSLQQKACCLGVKLGLCEAPVLQWFMSDVTVKVPNGGSCVPPGSCSGGSREVKHL
jgi:hypothetical protein